jgi:virulence-associated protein VagC
MSANRALARVFMNGRSRHVTIPVNFRFRTFEVSIRRDAESGDVILPEIRPVPEVFAAFDAEPLPDGLLGDAGRDRRRPQARRALDELMNGRDEQPA